jgi:hypothetical protein
VGWDGMPIDHEGDVTKLLANTVQEHLHILFKCCPCNSHKLSTTTSTQHSKSLCFSERTFPDKHLHQFQAEVQNFGDPPCLQYQGMRQWHNFLMSNTEKVSDTFYFDPKLTQFRLMMIWADLLMIMSHHESFMSYSVSDKQNTVKPQFTVPAFSEIPDLVMIFFMSRQ